jgi:uridine monophosphate synthetase
MEHLAIKRVVIDKLLAIGIIKYGHFILKSGMESSIYFDFRQLISHPTIFQYICQLAEPSVNSIKASNPGRMIRFLGIPMGAIPLATFMSQYFEIPSLMLRTISKDHGTKKLIEGEWNTDDLIILVDDVFTTGTSITETIDFITKNITGADFDLSNIITICDRSYSTSTTKFPKLQSIFKLEEFEPTSSIMTYPVFQNTIANRLYRIAIAKKSNIIVAADYSNTAQITCLIEKIGHLIVGVKIHIDIIHDVDPGFIAELKFLKAKHNLILIEDIKAGDISEITLAKLKNPRNGILEWADAITVHSISGLPKLCNLGMIPVIEMSCNSLITAEYTKRSLEIMRDRDISIAGCVIQNVGNMAHKWEFLGMTPGINLDTSAPATNPSSNQKYKNPLEASSSGLFWIVGRGITSKLDILESAQEYRKMGWHHFLKY